MFETKVQEVMPYLRGGHILLVSDTDADSEEVVLQGAAAGIPMVMSRTDTREDVFEHGESAFLCEASDTQAFTDRINDLLNNIGLRKQFTINAQDIIREHFHSDPREYREAYRTSIEQAFFIEAETADEDDEEDYY